MPTKKVAVIIGSLRKESINRKMANALIKMAPPSLAMEIVEIGDLSLFNDDLEASAPQPWVDFRAKVKACDAILFVSAEYNRSIPGVLKNAIDIGSRPSAANAWNGKPAGIVTVSPGAAGGFGSHHHLRQVMVGINMSVMPQPEACVGSASAIFNEDNSLVDRTASFMQKYINAFGAWVVKQTV